MILVIDSCIRGEDSGTRKLYECYLEEFEKGEDIKTIYLTEENISPLSIKDLKKRDELLTKQEFDNEIFKYANDFKNADKIIIAAPYWDLSFPSILKVYIEHIMANGITFGYEGPNAVGYSKADKLLFFSTIGGFTNGVHLGADYIKAIANMLGIPDFKMYSIEGLDIDFTQRDKVLEEGINIVMEEIEESSGK